MKSEQTRARALRRQLTATFYRKNKATFFVTAGAMLLLGGFSGVAGELYQERDQGTILRMKCVPRGLTGYLTGKTISTTLTTFLLVGVTLVLGSLLFEGVGPSSLRSWVLLAAFGILGMAATVP